MRPSNLLNYTDHQLVRCRRSLDGRTSEQTLRIYGREVNQGDRPNVLKYTDHQLIQVHGHLPDSVSEHERLNIPMFADGRPYGSMLIFIAHNRRS